MFSFDAFMQAKKVATAKKVSPDLVISEHLCRALTPYYLARIGVKNALSALLADSFRVTYALLTLLSIQWGNSN